MRKILTLGTILLVSGGLLTGCSVDRVEGDNTSNHSSSQLPVSDQDNDVLNLSTPDSAASSYVKKLASESQNAYNSLNLAGNKAIEIIGADNTEALQQTSNGRKKLRSLSPEQLDKLAKNYSQYDPLSAYYYTTGMSNSDKVEMSLYMLATSSVFKGNGDMSNVTIPNGAVSEDNDKTTIDLSNVTFDNSRAKNQAIPGHATGMPQKLHLKKDDSKWMLDGTAMVKEFEQ